MRKALANRLKLSLFALIGATHVNATEEVCTNFFSVDDLSEATVEFVDALHFVDGCKKRSDCMFPLFRRESDYLFLLNSTDEENWGGGRSKFTFSFLRRVDEIMGVRGRFTQELSDVNYLVINIVPSSISGEVLEAFVSNFVAPSTLDFPEHRTDFFKRWLDSDLLCTGLRTQYPDSIIRDVSIWVKNEATEAEFQRCIQQETLKLLGVGRLENPGRVVEGRSIRSSGPVLTERDYFFLKLAYSHEFATGQSPKETRQKLPKAIGDACD